MNRLFLHLCLLSSISLSLFAQENIPEPLKPWTAWVLEGNEHLTCPSINNANYAEKSAHLCAWPGVLIIDANDSGATFEQHWQVLVESLIPLPGNNDHWPNAVTINNQAQPIIEHSGKPTIKLMPGDYTINGLFQWSSRPTSMGIPESTALTKQHINGQEVPFPKIEGSELWFQASTQNESELDTIDIDVVRRISDGPHILSETIITLGVSGKSREVILGKPMLDGFSLIGIKGNVPAFLDAEGLLHAKLKPGEWDIAMQTYAPPETLVWARQPVMNEWPKEEVWVFSSKEKMRIGKLSGAKLIDSNQVTMPGRWHSLPSYVVLPENKLVYDIQHRGKPLHLENQLSLKRTLWMAFDRSIYTFNDNINGDMIEGWRLSLPQPFMLESAEDQDGSMLITTISEQERGIENRYPKVNIAARGVIDYTKELPVTGWDSDFERVSGDLNIPPGNKLFAVFGADRATDTWWGNWSIWSSFIVLLASIVAGRLISITAGLVTGIMLLMIYQESGAPVIAILNLLAAITIHRHQPFERLRASVNAYWVTSTVLAIGAILIFSATQIRTVIHPQLASKNTTYANDNFSGQTDLAEAVPSSRQLASESISTQKTERVEKIQITGSRITSASIIERYQSDALIQAGSGVPNWQWNRHTVSWSSPVAAGQTFDIIVISSNTYRLLKIFSILVIVFWLYSVSKDALLSIASKIKQQHLATTVVLIML